MKLDDEIIKMIQNKEYDKNIYFKHYYSKDRTDLNRIIIKEIEDTDFVSIYFKSTLKDDYSRINSSSTHFIAIANKNTCEILYGNPELEESKYIENWTPEDISKNKKILKKTKEKVMKFKFENLKQLEDKVLEKIEEKDIENIDANDLYYSNNMNKNPLHEYYTEITADMIALNNFNDEKLRKISISEINQKDFESFERYVASKEAIRRFKINIKKDPLKVLINNIKKVIDDNEHKTINVYYKIPNGTILNEKINKTNSINNLNRELLEKNSISNIPVVSIQKIIWGKKKELYNKENSPEIKLTPDEYKLYFIKAGCIEDLDEEDYNNKNIMKKSIQLNLKNYNYIDEELKKDKNFLIEVVKDFEKSVQLANFYMLLNDTLKEDKSFVKDLLDNAPIKEYSIMSYYSDFPKEINDKLLKKEPFNENKDLYISIIKKISVQRNFLNWDPNIWNEPEIIDFLKNHELSYGLKNDIIRYINNIETIKKIYTKKDILNCINFLSLSIMHDKFFISSLLRDSETPVLTGNISQLCNIYKFDETMNKLIFYNINNETAANIFFENIIEKYDSELMFKIVNENISFFNLLNRDDMSLYLDGEISDNATLDVGENKKLILKCDNSSYLFDDYYLKIFNDKNECSIISKNSFFVKEKIMKKIKEIFPEIKSSSFKTVYSQAVNILGDKKENQKKVEITYDEER